MLFNSLFVCRLTGQLDDCGEALFRAAAAGDDKCHDVQLGGTRLRSVSGARPSCDLIAQLEAIVSKAKPYRVC